jgi:hypothetical protein
VFLGARGLGQRLLLGLLLGLLKDTQNLPLKLREIHGEDDAARVKDEIEARRQKINVAAESLAHAALDAVALVGLADDLADSEADARGNRSSRALKGLRGDLRGKEPAHGSGLALAAGSIGAQIVSVLAQARIRQSLALGWLGS